MDLEGSLAWQNGPKIRVKIIKRYFKFVVPTFLFYKRSSIEKLGIRIYG